MAITAGWRPPACAGGSAFSHPRQYCSAPRWWRGLPTSQGACRALVPGPIVPLAGHALPPLASAVWWPPPWAQRADLSPVPARLQALVPTVARRVPGSAQQVHLWQGGAGHRLPHFQPRIRGTVLFSECLRAPNKGETGSPPPSPRPPPSARPARRPEWVFCAQTFGSQPFHATFFSSPIDFGRMSSPQSRFPLEEEVVCAWAGPWSHPLSLQ